ncbi:hypothetical protein QJQ45_015579, partial [Haematococcus lacustris]
IGAVRDSYRRSQDVRERRRLEVIWDPATAPSSGSTPAGPHAAKAATVAVGGVGAVRLPKRFREVVAVDHDLPPLAVQMGPSSVLAGARQAGGLAAKSASSATPKKGQAKGGEEGEEEEEEAGGKQMLDHLPPATYDPEQFTLLKMYNVDAVLLQTVLSGLTDAQVELPFKLSPAEWDIITQVPHPPAPTILLGRSGTGKTTCAVYRIWVQWLRSYKEWVPGTRAIAAAAAQDAAIAAGDVEGAVAAGEAAAKALGRATVFVTASGTLKEQVRRAFRRMQMAAMPPEEYQAAEAAGQKTYHSMADVPFEAFPLFLSSRQYLHMLDGSLEAPFFRRRRDGSIVQEAEADEVDQDSADVVVDLDFGQGDDEEGDEEEEEGGAVGQTGLDFDDGFDDEPQGGDGMGMDETETGGEEGDAAEGDAAAALAGRVSVKREVTYNFFVAEMWDKVT